MTQVARTAPKLHLPAGRAAVPALVAEIGRFARQWTDRRRSRIALARLDDRLIRDIGLDRVTCEDEAFRPFWR